MRGLVYRSTGSWYEVRTEDGRTHASRIKGKFRIQGLRSTNPVAVGDWVNIELEKKGDEEIGIITDIEDRKNYIVRKSVKLSAQLHIIAANIDQVFVAVTLSNPVTYPIFVDRFLATAEAYDVPAVLLFTKTDMYSKDELEQLKGWEAIYERVGYPVLATSVEDGRGVGLLKDMMRGKVNMFAGHSGVGKSTLINALEPGLSLRTGDISDYHRQGQHVTTFAEMHDLSFGAKIIDTPGIRGFGVVDMEPDEVGDYFPEILKRKEDCKFNNCLHMDEPQCAIKQAVEDGEISETRYYSYLQIVQNEEDTYRIDPYKGLGE